LGYRPGQLPNGLNGDLPTTNTCRHTMQLALLLKALRALAFSSLLLCVSVCPGVRGRCVCGWAKTLYAPLPSSSGDDGLDMGAMSIVEIGGGYANMARLVGKAYGFRAW
jgi:hypothetical protein